MDVEFDRIATNDGETDAATDTACDGTCPSCASRSKGEPAAGPGWARIIIAFSLFAAGLLLRPWLREQLYGLAEYLFFLTAWLIAGKEVLLAAMRNILRGKLFDENFLMSLATLGAIALGELPEAAAVMLFYTVGEWFQDRAVRSARGSIEALMQLRPDVVHVTGEPMKDLSPEEVEPGTEIVVRPGERIPLDGVLTAGSSWVDLAALTGESRPVLIKPGDRVLSGGINREGMLTLRTLSSYGDSALARIIRLVEQASERKASSERFITRFARYYTPLVTAAALLLAVIPPLLTGASGFGEWIHRALVLLVISCPCALVISIPLTYFAGIGGAGREGILVKGANYLEALARIDTVVFDKTGTLTEGRFLVEQIEPAPGQERERVLEMAAAAEAHSGHPAARAIREAAESMGIVPGNADHEHYQEFAGEGVIASVGKIRVYAGREQLLTRHGIALPDLPQGWKEHNSTIVHVGTEAGYLGRIGIRDRIKEGARGIGRSLKSLGILRSIMLTGDQEGAAAAIAEEADIDEYHSSLMPEDKLDLLERYMQLSPGKGTCAFLGDGINDAPVLSRADIGIAMGGIGSDAAIEAADVVFIDDKPEKLLQAVKGAVITRSIMIQNVVFALGFKVVVMALGAFGIAGMWMAVLADVGVALLAVLNASRALKAFSKRS